MILIGPARMINTPGFSNTKVRPGFIINFTGLIEIPRSILVPGNNLGAVTEYDFDMKYRDWLMMDNDRFLEVFKIASEQINGNDVYLIRSEALYEFEYNIIESFLKFMQSRYGTRSLYINTEEDWEIYLADRVEGDIIFQDSYIVQDDFMRYCSLTKFEEPF